MSTATLSSSPASDLLASLAPGEIGPLYTSIFERLGYFTTPAQGPAAKIFDYIIYKPDLSEPEIALRCRYDNGTIFTEDVAYFWDSITSHGYKGGIFATNKVFAPHVSEFSEGKSLRLIDRNLLQAGVEDLPDHHRSAILDRRWAARQSVEFNTRQSIGSFNSSIPCAPSPIAAAFGRLKSEIANAPHLAYSLHRFVQMNPSIY